MSGRKADSPAALAQPPAMATPEGEFQLEDRNESLTCKGVVLIAEEAVAGPL